MPADDLEALMNPPGYLESIDDGSEADQISSHIQAAISQANDNRYQQAYHPLAFVLNTTIKRFASLVLLCP